MNIEDVIAKYLESRDRPEIVCLIGSSKFKEIFQKEGERLEKTGHLVLAMTFFQHADGVEITEQERDILEIVDKFRIDLCDRVRVLNAIWIRCNRCKIWKDRIHTHVGVQWRAKCTCYKDYDPLKSIPYESAPYIGESTHREIDYATLIGKPIEYLHP